MASINTTEIIATSKFNRFHLGLLLWSLLIIAFDGYDLVVFGTVVPVLIEQWNLTSVEAGAMGSYGLFGMMFGAIFFGTLADRIGRKNVIAITVILFSLFTVIVRVRGNANDVLYLPLFSGLRAWGHYAERYRIIDGLCTKINEKYVGIHRAMRLFGRGNSCTSIRDLPNAGIWMGVDLLDCRVAVISLTTDV